MNLLLPIQLIRNKKNHYHELSAELTSIIGENIDDLFDYFNKKFPKLFFFMYQYSSSKQWKLLSLESSKKKQ